MEIINQAEPRFRYLQDTVCEPLLDLLREINALEMKFGKRDTLIMEKIPELDRVQISSEFDALWSDFHDEYERIVSGKCTEKLLAKGYGNCIHQPPKYRWMDTEDCVVIFRMDKPKRAIVEASFKVGTQDTKHRFTLIKQGEEWLVDAFNHWSTYDEIWHRGTI